MPGCALRARRAALAAQALPLILSITHGPAVPQRIARYGSCQHIGRLCMPSRALQLYTCEDERGPSLSSIIADGV